MNEAMAALDEGLAVAESGDEVSRRRERAVSQQVRAWHAERDAAREFDKAIREQMAKDRRYARGDSGFEVSVNILGANIDTMVSFIYSRDPDVDVIPAQMVEAPKDPPPQPPMPPPGLQGLMANPVQALAAGGGDMQQAAFAAGEQLAEEQARHQEAVMQYEQAMAQYQAAQEEKRLRRIERALFAQSIEVVVAKLWQRARMKRQARRAVRSALTTGIGWVKVSWQERTQRDPVIQQQLNDLQDNLRWIARQIDALDDPANAGELEGRKLAIEQQMAGLRARAEKVVARGLAVDFVSAENMQVAPGVNLLEYHDAPWVAERVFMTLHDALVRWPDIEADKLRRATRWQRRSPKREHGAPEEGVSDSEADQFVSGEIVGQGQRSDNDFICVWEKWSLDDGLVYRTAEGLDFWLDEPEPPNVMSGRFYPYFALAFLEVDGERAPESLVARTWRLQNEYNRTRSAYAEMRRRAYPGVLFDEGELAPGYAAKLANNARQEFIGVRTVSGRAVGEVFAPKPVSALDPAMYDTAPILRDIDRIWGIQEALQGSVETAKTATEAEIQQGGFQSRTGSMRDALEEWLGEIAKYTALAAVQKMDADDVRPLAGPDAVWPQLDTLEELDDLVSVEIRAGSSGKPNTRAEREAWQVGLPMLQQAIQQVAQLRGSSPSEVADKIEALVEATFERAGDPVDVGRFIPQHEGQQAQPPGTPGGLMPQAPGMPPVQEPAGQPPVNMEMMQ